MNYILHFINIILLFLVRHRVRVGNPNEKHTNLSHWINIYMGFIINITLCPMLLYCSRPIIGYWPIVVLFWYRDAIG